MKKTKIKLSILIICRNEEKYISRCLDSLLNQKKINNEYEIIVADGMSDDNTYKIVDDYSEKYRNIILFSNDKKIVPPGLNKAIKISQGEIIVRCDAHTIYDEYFLANGLKLFEEHPECECIGGPITSIGDTPFGDATAEAMSSIIGIGNAYHRKPDYEGYAEGAFWPFFKRTVFEKVGLFDEYFVRNQDDEFNYRMKQKGIKVYLSPKVKSYYHVRGNPQKLFSQYFQYGYWRIATIRKHKKTATLRHLIPAGFYLSMIATAVITFFTSLNPVAALVLPVFYLSIIVGFSIPVLIKKGFLKALYFIVAVIILHSAYAFGFIKAAIDLLFKRNIFSQKYLREFYAC